MYTPQAVYSLREVVGKRSQNLIWAKIMEGRYCVEVQHTAKHKGNLLIFDGMNHFRMLHEEPVELHYDGNSIDSTDEQLWEDIAKQYLDQSLRD